GGGPRDRRAVLLGESGPLVRPLRRQIQLPRAARGRTGDRMTATIEPDAIADALGIHRPTREQAEVIAGPAEPTLVLAGAGAGKTETMAARVVWLVANGYARPG